MTERGARRHVTARRARIAQIEGSERVRGRCFLLGSPKLMDGCLGGSLALGALHEVAAARRALSMQRGPHCLPPGSPPAQAGLSFGA